MHCDTWRGREKVHGRAGTQLFGCTHSELAAYQLWRIDSTTPRRIAVRLNYLE
jgi:hypothetical protein